MPDSKRILQQLADRFPGKRAAITGAGAGLGEALAIKLAAAGWTLWLNDKDAVQLEHVVQACEEQGAGKVYAAAFDVADRSDFQAGSRAFLSEEGAADLVFTCAGIGVGGAFLTCEPEHLAEAINVNLLGTMWAAKVFLPAMVHQKRGHIATIASAAAFHAMPELSAYAASKAGVVQFSETIRSELKPFGVGVTTKMTTFYTSTIAEHTRGTEAEREKARSLVEMAPWGAEAVAHALLEAVTKRRFYLVAPGQARFLWRVKRLLPELYLRAMPSLFRKLEHKLLAKAAARQEAGQ
jgi:short-subunit dehydrogenase